MKLRFPSARLSNWDWCLPDSHCLITVSYTHVSLTLAPLSPSYCWSSGTVWKCYVTHFPQSPVVYLQVCLPSLRPTCLKTHVKTVNDISKECDHSECLSLCFKTLLTVRNLVQTLFCELKMTQLWLRPDQPVLLSMSDLEKKLGCLYLQPRVRDCKWKYSCLSVCYVIKTSAHKTLGMWCFSFSIYGFVAFISTFFHVCPFSVSGTVWSWIFG